MMPIIDYVLNPSDTAPRRMRLIIDISISKDALNLCHFEPPNPDNPSVNLHEFEELVIALLPAFQPKFLPELLAAATARRLANE